MKRYTQLPFTLYRIQPRMPVKLRRYDEQMKLGRASFDLITHNELVIPVEGSKFEVPNGMSLRPASDIMVQLLQNYRGEPTIYCLTTGLLLPTHFCIYHEHSDHYSLQTTRDTGYNEFNHNLTEFLNSLPQMTKATFLEKMNDLDDQEF
jgi:hypothetical protein